MRVRKFDLGSGSRREFLKAGLRACALGGLALTGTVLGLRTFSRDAGSSSFCPVDLPCRSCTQRQGCAEPRAVRFRKESASPGSGSGPQEKGAGRD